MIARILVPLDRSPLAERALLEAVEIGKRAGAALRLVHAWQPLPAPRGEFLGPSLRQLDARGREEMAHYLADTADWIAGGAGLQVETAVLDAPVAETICDDALASACDLIVMSTHGRTGWSRMWLGSVADHVVRHAAVPVLLVRPQEEAPDAPAPPPLARLLVPLDGSAEGAEVLEPLRDLLLLFAPACVLLQVVVPARTPQFVTTLGLPVLLPDAAATAQAVREARDYLDRAADGLRDALPLLRVDTRVEVSESPAAAIVEAASACDLVAMATHGRGPARLVLGSVADKVLRGSRASVLLVRRRAPAGDAPVRAPDQRDSRRASTQPSTSPVPSATPPLSAATRSSSSSS